MRIGVLALQGDFAAHAAALPGAAEVRRAEELEALDLFVIPGGESTTMLKLLADSGIEDAAQGLLKRGGVIFGTCAGTILLANEVTNPKQYSWNLLDMEVQRNGFGRQVDSFEAVLEPDYQAVFIRAPRIRRVGPEVEVLARWQGEPVFVRQGRVFAATFHPELTADRRVQERVLNAARTARR